ncbi:MAG: hypothetical protein N4A35_11945 [Flavobacteriales bacterium]|jgi:hypothetical protein|nr:hypothetical protein [Flavobacteriales bacterium]
MKNRFVFIIVFITILLIGCQEETVEYNQELVYEASMKEMTDEEYPDNNDIESRCADWERYKHHQIKVQRIDTTNFTLTFYPSNKHSDTITIENINLLEWIPTIPDYLVDDYLKRIGIINAEWNRQQVQFVGDEFDISKHTTEGKKTVRVDLARNCLNSYLWELITYAQEGEQQKPLYHGWFEFPRAFYEELFDEVNKGKLTFDEYKDYLINYQDLVSKEVNFKALRTINSSKEVAFVNLNHEFYPLTGARKSKFKNIVYPKAPKAINDFLNDTTSFSTFLYPGYYSTADPRSTTLSKLRFPKKVVVRAVTSNNKTQDQCLEFEISFSRGTDTTQITRVVIGGVQKAAIPQLATQDYNKGFKMPMGIGNHGFYEKAEYAQKHSTKNNPYYAVIVNKEGKWLDSHFFGVDGPLLHFDESDPELLHFWLLSFERHAMVTHLTFKIN